MKKRSVSYRVSEDLIDHGTLRTSTCGSFSVYFAPAFVLDRLTQLRERLSQRYRCVWSWNIEG
ncbi:hypothetical protein N9M41_02785 [Rhodopirellula sp.]|nr:hypothetical protein [Rhodopirellula sp.]